MGFKFSESILKVFETLGELFSGIFEDLMTPIRDLFELFKDIKPIEKIKYKPVREIKPTKTFLLNKRFNMYYCRNNC